MVDKLLGKRIGELRTEREYTQGKVADELGISLQEYTCIENGFCNISLDILSNVSRIFGVTVADITNILDEEPSAIYRASGDTSFADVFDMLDLFYANKHLCEKIQYASSEREAMYE